MQERAYWRDPEHLIHQILNRTGEVPSFSLLLGSGASVTSGVETAEQMISSWRATLYGRAQDAQPIERWLASQPWYENEAEYALLFEMMHDLPAQRRMVVENALANASPNWGYVYLTSALQAKLFDLVFTTNFDDLLNEACYLFTDGLRPMVAAHESSIATVRIASSRPKIIKLHGDFLYDTIKNTVSELQALAPDTKNKFGQFATEYGLIVIGYSGRDQSVMDALTELLGSEENFRQGVYWCVRAGHSPGKRLQAFLRDRRVFLVEIDGFDQFLADLHEAAGLGLPMPIAHPQRAARDRSRVFVNVRPELKAHPVIGGHVDAVLLEIATESEELTRGLPPEFVASSYEAAGKQELALANWKKAYAEQPQDATVAFGLANLLALMGKTEELTELLENLALTPYNASYFWLRVGDNDKVIEVATVALADNEDDAISRINRAIGLKRLGKLDLMKEDLTRLDQANLVEQGKWDVAAGVAALKNEKDLLISHLRLALAHGLLSATQVRTYPVFEDVVDDPDVAEVLRRPIIRGRPGQERPDGDSP